MPQDDLEATQPMPGLAEAPKRGRMLVAVMAVAGIAASMSQTLVVPLIPDFPQIFDSNPVDTSWIITITLLVGAVATPISGRLADMYGKRRMLLVLTWPLIIGSVLCALSTVLPVMIIGRALQGVTLGLLPVALSLLHDVLPPRQATAAIAVVSSTMGIGGALGIPVAAGAAAAGGWQVIFWLMAGAGAVTLVALTLVVPSVPAHRGTARFDFVGAVGLMLGVTALLLAITKGSDWGWASPRVIGGIVLSLVVLIGWGRFELRRPEPLIALRTTVRPVVLLTNIASLLIGFSMYGMNLIAPQLLQLPIETGHGLGRSLFHMGLWYAPMGLGMFGASRLGASVSTSRGPQVTLAWAGVGIAAGYGLLAVAMATFGHWPAGTEPLATVWTMLITLVVLTLLIGCGLGFAFGAMPALILGAVPATEKAAANGFNVLMRGLGTTSSAAVLGVVLASMTSDYHGRDLPTLTAFVVALAIGGVVSLAAAGLAAAIPRDQPTPPR